MTLRTTVLAPNLPKDATGAPPLDPLIGLPAADSNDPLAEVERHALVAVEDCDSNRLQSESD